MSKGYISKTWGMLGAVSAAMIGMFAVMSQQHADRDLVLALLENDWKTAIRKARTLSRYKPHDWRNIGMVVEQAAARAGHPVGKRGRRLAKLGVEIPTNASYIKPSEKEWQPEEVMGQMMAPVVVKDPLTQKVWAVVEQPFLGNRVGSWIPYFVELLEAAQTLVDDPSNEEARALIAEISNQSASTIEHYNNIKHLMRTDIKEAKRVASDTFFDAFNIHSERRRQLLRRSQRKAGMWGS